MNRTLLKSTTSILVSISLGLPNAAYAEGHLGMSQEDISAFCEEPFPDLQATEFSVCEQTLTEQLADGTIQLDDSGLPVSKLEIADNGTVTVLAGETGDNATSEAVIELEPQVEANETAVLEDAPIIEETPQTDAEPMPAVEAEVQADQVPLTDAQVLPTETATEETATEETATESVEPQTTESNVNSEASAEQPTQPEPTQENSTDMVADDGVIIAPITEGAKTVEVVPSNQQAEVSQEDTQASTESANQTTSVAAEADATAGEVVTEVVTAEQTRSSSEEFTARAAAQPTKKGSGLNNFEKFAVGALAIGAASLLLKNNNDKVVSNSGDRVVVQQDDGNYYVLKDDDVLLRRPGSEVATRTFDDGSKTQTIIRQDGSQVTTIRAANGQVLRRTRTSPEGITVVLFDDTVISEPVDVANLAAPIRRNETKVGSLNADELRLALARADSSRFNRRYSLQQVRQIRAVRELVPEIEVNAVTFETGSAAIQVSQAEELGELGRAMRSMIAEAPYEVFLVEGHTDAVGSAASNLALSDRRAESMALALTEYFDVPPENLVVQGYGESNLKIRSQGDIRANRRATVRRITNLLQASN